MLADLAEPSTVRNVAKHWSCKVLAPLPDRCLDRHLQDPARSSCAVSTAKCQAEHTVSLSTNPDLEVGHN